MRKATQGFVAALALALTATLALTAPSHAALGNRSLASKLTSDGNHFDRNRNDYDITTEAVLAVLKAKPGSPVGVLTQGNVALTAFVPTDQAFRRLGKALTGRWIRSEKVLFDTLVAKLGVDTIETVLLYHVVPGATITRKQAFASDGARLTTAQGGTVGVNVRYKPRRVKLQDQDYDAQNPTIRRFNINVGNKQIAHGINRVLRPTNL